MRKVVKGVFVLSILTVTFFMLVPLSSRGLSWSEASVPILLGTVISMAAAFAWTQKPPPTLQQDPTMVRYWKRQMSGRLLLTLSILFGLLGLIVLLRASDALAQDLAFAERDAAKGGYNLYAAYAKSDQVGVWLGWGAFLLSIPASIAAFVHRGRR